MTVTQKTPTFEAIQWTGANQSTVEDFVDDILGATATYLVLEDDTLKVTQGSFFNLFLPLNHFAVHGPRWGSDVSQATFLVRSPAEFTAQFE